MENFVKNVGSTTLLKTLVLFIVVLFFQNCNSSVEEVGPDSGILNSLTNTEKNTISTIQKLKSFKELVQLQDNHINLAKLRKIKVNKLDDKGLVKYQSMLSNAKAKEDLRAAFSLITTDPNEVVEFLELSGNKMIDIERDIASLKTNEKADKNLVDKYANLALRDFRNKRNSTRNAKLDCEGQCSNNFNMALYSAQVGYSIAISACALGGYVGAAASGPFVVPVGIVVGVSELACIGLSYYSYSVSFNMAIQGFDVCYNGCGGYNY